MKQKTLEEAVTLFLVGASGLVGVSIMVAVLCLVQYLWGAK